MTRTGIVLEMTNADQLIKSEPRSVLMLNQIAADQGSRIGSLYRQIWEPIGGGGRSEWTDQQWIEELSEPGKQAWIAQFGDQDAGMAELGWSGNGDAGFVVIGIVPRLQGQGLGGDLLSRLTQLLWTTPAPNGQPTTRVWIWTIPDEHPHTIPNYLARGFKYAASE